jgi:hypothetical protein
VARVASVQKLAEKRGAATPFRKVGKGESLAIADSLRTGKRSKAELKFADGSLLRLGQLTSIEIRAPKGVRLTGGRLLFAALRPGRVLAGNGTGEVKGSVAIVALDPDNTAEFTLYSGSMDVIGDRTVTLLPGQSVRVDPQGVLSRVRRAPPFGFQGGELHPDLITSPERGPFTGGEVNERIREGADRTAVDQLIPPILAPGGGFRRGQPFPTPFPTPLPGRTLRAERSGADFSSTAAGSNSRSSWRRSLGMRSPSATARAAAAPVLHLAVAPSASRIALNSVNNAEPDGGASTSASTPDSTLEAGGTQVLADFDLDVRPALDHIDDVDRSRGRFGNADARVVGAAADEGASIYGARMRGFGAVGKVYFEATLAPLQLRREGNTVGYSSIATGFLLARDTRGELRIGRQRFVSGPTQAAFSGSLVRQGGRETMDAIRVTSRPRGGLQFEAAYIFDAFPRNLPFLAADRTAGSQKAVYGRVALRQPNFALGLNALKYSSSSLFLPGVSRPARSTRATCRSLHGRHAGLHLSTRARRGRVVRRTRARPISQAADDSGPGVPWPV